MGCPRHQQIRVGLLVPGGPEQKGENMKTFTFAPDEHMMLKEGLRRMLVGVQRGEITDDKLTHSVEFIEALQEKLGWPDDGEE